MTPRAPQAPRFRRTAWWKWAAVGLMALSTAGCLRKGAADITGSIPNPQQATPEIWRRQSDIWGPRFEANPADPMAAISYAQALRALDQRPQAVAVLQQAAIRNPNNREVLAAYGKTLADVGRYKEASQVLSRAHTPERPDWRILSAQGAVADQTGDHVLAQQYYESALKLAAGGAERPLESRIVLRADETPRRRGARAAAGSGQSQGGRPRAAEPGARPWPPGQVSGRRSGPQAGSLGRRDDRHDSGSSRRRLRQRTPSCSSGKTSLPQPIGRVERDYFRFITWMIAGVRMTTKSTGRKNRIIGTVSLGGSAAAFFSASFIRISRLSWASTRSACPSGVP